MQTLTRPPPTRVDGEHVVTRSSLVRSCDAVLDVTVVVLASWTVVYHVSLVLGLSARLAFGVEVLALAGATWLWWRQRAAVDGPDVTLGETAPALVAPAVDPTVVDRVAVGTAVGSAAAAAVLVAQAGDWRLIAALWMSAALAGTVAAVRRFRATARHDAPPHDDDRDRGRATGAAVVALLWATALAVLSMFTRRPNPDDLYYVNLSQWVVDHGTFPLRDTIFSDLVFPMSSWPPVASYDGLAGTAALLAGVSAASVVYLVVPPVATFLSVLAMWRLLRHWRLRAVGVALSVALVFLLYDGGPGYAAPGTLFLTRLWQGKVILLCLLVPTLLVYALRYVERPSRSRAWWLLAGGIAAVGLSTSAMFLVPLIAVAGVAPLALRRPPRALLGCAAMAAYPLAAGIVTLAVGGRSADFFETRRLFRFDPAWFGPEIFRDGPIALIAVAAVLAGALLLPHAAGRVTVGVLTIIVGVTFVPGVTEFAFELVGLGPTLWRVSWIVPIAALVGVLVVRVGSFGDRRGVLAATAVAAAAALAVSGIPIWSEGNGVELDTAPSWKRGPETVDTAQRVIDLAHPGDLVLAHQQLAVTITVLTTRIKTVAPRDYFMDYLRDDPSFGYTDRQTLLDFVNEPFQYRDRSQVAEALARVDVDHVCLKARSFTQVGLLRSLDYEQVVTTTLDRCFTRPSSQRG